MTIRGVDLEVTGISAEGLAVLRDQLEWLRDVVAVRGANIGFEDVRKIVPDVLASTVAAGCGRPGDPAAIRVARSLGVGEQWEIVEAILDVTFPQGADHFLRNITDFFKMRSPRNSSGSGAIQ